MKKITLGLIIALILSMIGVPALSILFSLIPNNLSSRYNQIASADIKLTYIDENKVNIVEKLIYDIYADEDGEPFYSIYRELNVSTTSSIASIDVLNTTDFTTTTSSDDEYNKTLLEIPIGKVFKGKIEVTISYDIIDPFTTLEDGISFNWPFMLHSTNSIEKFNYSFTFPFNPKIFYIEGQRDYIELDSLSGVLENAGKRLDVKSESQFIFHLGFEVDPVTLNLSPNPDMKLADLESAQQEYISLRDNIESIKQFNLTIDYILTILILFGIGVYLVLAGNKRPKIQRLQILSSLSIPSLIEPRLAAILVGQVKFCSIQNVTKAAIFHLYSKGYIDIIPQENTDNNPASSVSGEISKKKKKNKFNLNNVSIVLLKEEYSGSSLTEKEIFNYIKQTNPENLTKFYKKLKYSKQYKEQFVNSNEYKRYIAKPHRGLLILLCTWLICLIGQVSAIFLSYHFFHTSSLFGIFFFTTCACSLSWILFSLFHFKTYHNLTEYGTLEASKWAQFHQSLKDPTIQSLLKNRTDSELIFLYACATGSRNFFFLYPQERSETDLETIMWILLLPFYDGVDSCTLYKNK